VLVKGFRQILAELECDGKIEFFAALAPVLFLKAMLNLGTKRFTRST
jgi:hypothetical protein